MLHVIRRPGFVVSALGFFSDLLREGIAGFFQRGQTGSAAAGAFTAGIEYCAARDGRPASGGGDGLCAAAVRIGVGIYGVGGIHAVEHPKGHASVKGRTTVLSAARLCHRRGVIGIGIGVGVGIIISSRALHRYLDILFADFGVEIIAVVIQVAVAIAAGIGIARRFSLYRDRDGIVAVINLIPEVSLAAVVALGVQFLIVFVGVRAVAHRADVLSHGARQVKHQNDVRRHVLGFGADGLFAGGVGFEGDGVRAVTVGRCRLGQHHAAVRRLLLRVSGGGGDGQRAKQDSAQKQGQYSRFLHAPPP